MSGETILVVEDRRENIVHLANNVLKPQGYQVITAMDGLQGIKRAQADQPDLIIMDLNMPKMDGLEALAALKERKLGIPVILTTFYGSEQVAREALLLGAADYVVKPFTAEEMLSAVETALLARSPRPAEPPAPVSESDQVMPLTRQVERWMRDMNILTRVGKALVAQMDAEQVRVRAVEAAIYVTRSDYAFLFQIEEDRGLRLRAARGLQDRQTRLLDEEAGGGLAARVVQSGKTLLLKRVIDDLALTETAGGFLGPSIATPLRWQRRTVGVLIVTRSPGEPMFTDSDVEWLSGLSEYAAIATRNAQAFEHRPQPEPAQLREETTLVACRREIDQLVEELGAALGTAERLAAHLSEQEPEEL
jgi:CheY-like chemotaxis protein